MNANRTFNMIKILFLLSLALSLSSAYGKTVLITGSNRGIGLEFARQYAEKGWTVYATHRRSKVPDTLKALSKKYKNVHAEKMDVAKPHEIKSLAKKLSGKPIDVLINNAAIFNKEELKIVDGRIQMDKAQAFGSIDYEFLDEMIDVNAKGPLRVAEAFYSNILMSEEKKIIALTAGAGMLGRPPFPPGVYHFPATKTLLNKLMTILADDVKKDGVLVGILDPGGVKVEKFKTMGIPLNNMMEPEVAISSMIKVIENLKPEQSGKYMLYNGEPLPW